MRQSLLRFLLTLAVLVGGALTPLFAQTTYHLHDDSGTLQLKTANPDTAAVALSSQDIKNLSPGEFIINQFPTAAGVPGTAGVILSGSTVTFNLWMKVTSTAVSSFPRAKLFLDSTSGTQLCAKTGTTALTTTVTKYTLSCTTSANITLTASDTFLLWVGFNTSTKTTSSLIGQVDVEGTLNGHYDSTVAVPAIVPPPSITNLNVTSGPPGTSVTITGTNFGSPQGSSTVKFNGVSASVGSWAAGSITATVPSATTGNVIVTVNGQASNGVAFTIPAPTITSLFPLSGRYGTSITITGSNFGTTQAAGSSTVKFGTTAASPTSWSNTSIAVPVPSGATTGTVSVTVTVGVQSTSSNFVVIPPPNITGLSPTSGPINTMVTVSGSGFGSPQGTSTVKFNTTTAVPFSWGDSSIIVPVPANATTGSVVVTAGQASNSVTFTVTGAPSITTINPPSGAAGTGVTITGSNFGTPQGLSVVKFNGVAAKVTSWGSGSIAANAPPGVSTGPVTVTVSSQTSNGVTFTAVTTATLSGTVINTGSVGIVGATVQAFQNGVSKASTTTGSGGSYSISSLSAGTYDIQASASSYGTGVQNAIAIPANQTTTQNFTLSTPGGIGGKVTKSDGITAISGAGVQAYAGSALVGSATSDSGGNYTISGLNATAYRVQASASGYVTQSQTASVTGGSNATANFSLQLPGTAAIQYVYDELGRLVGAIDTGGDVATYQYDAVGNILSISRQGSSQVSIVSFTPRTGTSGTTVTINGTGFSTTPSQNTVQFHGTAATVTASTATQIVTSVPSGATSGTISVTTPSGSATSAATFTVASASGAPTITSFSPNMGVAGQAVSITGTNFDPSVANNDIVFNASRALTSSVVGTTQLNTALPSSTASGRISVSTPTGSVTSTQDFYVPFLSYGTSYIGYSGRVALGGNQTVSLPTATKIGLLLFDGSAGQGLSLQLSGSTFPSCTLYVFGPNGAEVAFNRSTQLYSDCTSATTLVSSIPLLSNGTYTIGIDPSGTTGTVTIALTPDFTSTIAINGAPVTATTTTVSQDARLSFSAVAGQRIVAYVTNVTNPGADLFLVRPDGTIQNPGGLFINNSPTGQTFFMDTQPLAKTGTYQLWVWHNGSNVGSETLQIASVPPDVSGSLTIGGSAFAFTTAVGQNANVTFNNPQSQPVTVHWTSDTYSPTLGCLMTATGPNFFNSQSYCNSTTGSFSLGTISAGTYNILVDPQLQNSGGISLTVTTP